MNVYFVCKCIYNVCIMCNVYALYVIYNLQYAYCIHSYTFCIYTYIYSRRKNN